MPPVFDHEPAVVDVGDGPRARNEAELLPERRRDRHTTLLVDNNVSMCHEARLPDTVLGRGQARPFCDSQFFATVSGLGFASPSASALSWVRPSVVSFAEIAFSVSLT